MHYPPAYAFDEEHLPIDARRIFVYGTLRVGASRWSLLENFGPNTNRGYAEGFGLFSDSAVDFPWMLPHPGATVRGDLLTFHDETFRDALAVCDQVEGYRPDAPEESNF